MSRSNVLKWLVSIATTVVVIAVAAALYLSHDRWLPLIYPESKATAKNDKTPPIEEAKMLKLSPQARKNLRLVTRPAKAQEYWRKIQVPGVIADRPGVSDRGVTSPAIGVISQIHSFAGDTVKPGDTLFTLRLLSESLQTIQSELFKASRETQLIAEERKRIEGLARDGTIAGSRLIELDLSFRTLKPATCLRVKTGQVVGEW